MAITVTLTAAEAGRIFQALAQETARLERQADARRAHPDDRPAVAAAQREAARALTRAATAAANLRDDFARIHTATDPEHLRLEAAGGVTPDTRPLPARLTLTDEHAAAVAQ